MNATDKNSLIALSNILSTRLQTSKATVKECYLLYQDLNSKRNISSLIFSLDLKFGLSRLSVYKQGLNLSSATLLSHPNNRNSLQLSGSSIAYRRNHFMILVSENCFDRQGESMKILIYFSQGLLYSRPMDCFEFF